MFHLRRNDMRSSCILNSNVVNGDLNLVVMLTEGLTEGLTGGPTGGLAGKLAGGVANLLAGGLAGVLTGGLAGAVANEAKARWGPLATGSRGKATLDACGGFFRMSCPRSTCGQDVTRSEGEWIGLTDWTRSEGEWTRISASRIGHRAVLSGQADRDPSRERASPFPGQRK